MKDGGHKRREKDQEKEVKVEVEHGEQVRRWTQKACVGEKEEEESRNSTYEDNDVSNIHMEESMVIRMDDGSSIWRAAKRAAEEAQNGDGVGGTQRQAEEAEGEMGKENGRDRPDNAVKTLSTSCCCCCCCSSSSSSNSSRGSSAHRPELLRLGEIREPQRRSLPLTGKVHPRETRDQDLRCIARSLFLLSRSRVSTSTVLCTRGVLIETLQVPGTPA